MSVVASSGTSVAQTHSANGSHAGSEPVEVLLGSPAVDVEAVEDVAVEVEPLVVEPLLVEGLVVALVSVSSVPAPSVSPSVSVSPSTSVSDENWHPDAIRGMSTHLSPFVTSCEITIAKGAVPVRMGVFWVTPVAHGLKRRFGLPIRRPNRAFTRPQPCVA